ncbi:unnamed protein product [Taenia asiatica]|uniref:Histone H2A n=1 Tax=Taenia asiatica TaxID=60517 RepID=A0A0R3WEH8_TAEAS|nr:unnamed protein product [Taenia asiatica]
MVRRGLNQRRIPSRLRLRETQSGQMELSVRCGRLNGEINGKWLWRRRANEVHKVVEVLHSQQSASVRLAVSRAYGTIRMSVRGKGGKSRAKAKTRLAWVGIQFPVGKAHRLLRHGNYTQRAGVGALVYLAVALEYLAAELNTRNDETLDYLLDGMAVVLLLMQLMLLPKKTEKSATTKMIVDQQMRRSTGR